MNRKHMGPAMGAVCAYPRVTLYCCVLQQHPSLTTDFASANIPSCSCCCGKAFLHTWLVKALAPSMYCAACVYHVTANSNARWLDNIVQHQFPFKIFATCSASGCNMLALYKQCCLPLQVQPVFGNPIVHSSAGAIMARFNISKDAIYFPAGKRKGDRAGGGSRLHTVQATNMSSIPVGVSSRAELFHRPQGLWNAVFARKIHIKKQDKLQSESAAPNAKVFTVGGFHWVFHGVS